MINKTRTFNISFFALWLLVFGGIPLLLLVATSFMQQHPEEFFTHGFTLQSYYDLLDPAYLQVFSRSVKLAGYTTIICLLAGYPFAWLTSQLPSKSRLVVLILLMIPFWTNSLIRTYAVRVILGTKGLLNKSLLALGFMDTPIRFMYTDFAVILGLVYLMLPFMILPLYASIEKFDFRLIEAAKDLGANRLQSFRTIVLPLTLPGILAGCIMVFVPTMGLFYVATLLGGSKKLLVGNLIQHQFLVSHNWPLGSAMSTVLIVIMLSMFALYWLVLKRFSTGEILK